MIIQVCLCGHVGGWCVVWWCGGVCGAGWVGWGFWRCLWYGIIFQSCSSAYCAGWQAVPTQLTNPLQTPTPPTQHHTPTCPHKHPWIFINPGPLPRPYKCAPFHGTLLLLKVTQWTNNGSNLSHINSIVVLMIKNFKGFLNSGLNLLVLGLWNINKESNTVFLTEQYDTVSPVPI